MKLVEIDDADRIWAKLNNIDLEIKTEYQLTIDLLNLLIKAKSPYRNQVWVPVIVSFEEKLQKIIDADFKNDKSTRAKKIEAHRYLQEIQKLKELL